MNVKLAYMNLLNMGIIILGIGVILRLFFNIPCTNCMDIIWQPSPIFGNGGEWYILGFISTGGIIIGIIIILSKLFSSKHTT